jgi:hypothetical protein
MKSATKYFLIGFFLIAETTSAFAQHVDQLYDRNTKTCPFRGWLKNNTLGEVKVITVSELQSRLNYKLQTEDELGIN